MRTRGDRCPGVLRPWPADDGLLVRIRLVAGRLEVGQLRLLSEAARRFGDGRVRSTSRANLQLRAFPDDGTGHVTTAALAALAGTGLLPRPSHDLVRNIMASPLTGLAGGRMDLRGVVDELDRRLMASAELARLPGKFLFVLDDGRGDVLGHDCDLGLVALDATTAQLRVGQGHGPMVGAGQAAEVLVREAERFVRRRGGGSSAAWHVAELDQPLLAPQAPHRGLPEPSAPLGPGLVAGAPGWRHVPCGEQGWDMEQVAAVADGAENLVVTPWHGVLVRGAGR